MANDTVPVTVRFITLMQRYSGKGNRQLVLELPPEPGLAVDSIIERYQIPWKDNLEKQVRIYVNRMTYDAFAASGEHLKGGDTIAFIPISGGG